MANDVDIFGELPKASAIADSDIFKDVLAKSEKSEAKPVPTTSKPMAANAGLANFGASVLGFPTDTVQSALNLGIAGAGRLTGTTPNLLQNSVGTSDWIRAMLRKTGVPGLSPDNPHPESQLDTAAYDLTSRGGFIPGGFLPAAASMAAEKIGGPAWGPVGALLPQSAITGYNAVRQPQLQAQQSQNALRDQTLKEAQDAGYVIPPSAASPSFVGNRLESIAGKAAIGQEAAARNQKTTNALAAKELGLPENTAISQQALEALRSKLSAPYREVAKIDPVAAQTLEELKQARFDANANYRYYEAMPNPEVLAKAKALQSKAEGLEQFLEGIAQNAGKPGLVDELRSARREIAKTFDVERALNVATGDVSARMLGRSVDKGKPLSGNLATAGKFAEAFPGYARDGAAIPTPGVSKSEALAGAILGLGGYGMLGPFGTALGALPLVSDPIRHALLSRPVQGALHPNYLPNVNPSPAPQLMYQLGILAQPQ